MSTHTGVSNFQKTVRFFWPTLYIYKPIEHCQNYTLKVGHVISNNHETKRYMDTLQGLSVNTWHYVRWEHSSSNVG